MSPALLLAGLASFASAVELSAGPMFEEGYRPGARAGVHWTLLDGERQRRNGNTTQHVLSGGPDLATYTVPGVRWSTLPGGTIAWRRSGEKGLRLEADVGVSLVVQKYLAPVYRVEGDELVEVPMAGRLKWGPTTRLGIGLGPTDKRDWGLVFRPNVLWETRNTMMLPVLATELAVTWRL